MKLLACGDSWAWGYELVDPTVQTIPISDIEIDPYNIHLEPANLVYRHKHRYVNLLADKINAEVIDLSAAGICNASIVHRLITWLVSNGYTDRKNNKDLFVSIGWTSPVRDYFYSDKYKKWVDYGPWFENINLENDLKNSLKEYTTHLFSMRKQLASYMKNIFMVEHMLKNLGINFIMHQAFYDNEHWLKESDTTDFSSCTNEEKLIFANVDSKHFANKYSSLYRLFQKDYKHYMYKWHPNEKGHRLIADYLYKHCKENNIL